MTEPTRYAIELDEIVPVTQEWVDKVQCDMAQFGATRTAARHMIRAASLFLNGWRPEYPPRLFYDIWDFHRKFLLEYSGPPRELPQDLGDFRLKFIIEEINEYREARIDHDLAKQFDALIDLVYVVLGTAYLHGFDFEEGWRRVHAANMSKVRAERAEDSTRSSTFDVIKPPGWKAPDLSDLV